MVSAASMIHPDVLDSPSLAGDFWEKAFVRCNPTVTEVQAVSDGTGAGTLAMKEKQLMSVGCPTILEVVGNI